MGFHGKEFGTSRLPASAIKIPEANLFNSGFSQALSLYLQLQLQSRLLLPVTYVSHEQRADAHVRCY